MKFFRSLIAIIISLFLWILLLHNLTENLSEDDAMILVPRVTNTEAKGLVSATTETYSKPRVWFQHGERSDINNIDINNRFKRKKSKIQKLYKKLGLQAYAPDNQTKYIVAELAEKVVGNFGVDIDGVTRKFTESGGQWSFRIPKGPPLRHLVFARNMNSSSSWKRFHTQIQQFALYDPSTDMVDRLLNDLATLPILYAAEKSGGTQLKLTIKFGHGEYALLKPQRFSRSYQTPDDHFYFDDFERHNAEIAAFHLDKVLGFYRAPPVSGRVINITGDIRKHANIMFLKTFFHSPVNNHCFSGTCDLFCDTGHAICGRPDEVEASLAAFLPAWRVAPLTSWRSPWRRSYSKHKKAQWEVDANFCDGIKQQRLYKSGRRLLDIMDIAVFDFLLGNMDRHSFMTFEEFGNFTFPIHWDNGRGFGKPFSEELSILAPIYQCCVIRYSTIVKLLVLYHSQLHLSDVMRRSLKRDTLPSALLEAHLLALDRRIPIILTTISGCLEKGHFIEDVIKDDTF